MLTPSAPLSAAHGTRVNAVTSEIGEQEKIDIIVWSEDPVQYITSALSPTKVAKVIIDEVQKKARVVVPEDQLSIAIGRGGQNVRLASKLTGYELDIEAEKPNAEASGQPEKQSEPTQKQKSATIPAKNGGVKLKKKSDLESSLLEAIDEHGE